MTTTAVSGVNTLNGNFYRTKVTDNGNGIFSSTLFRTDAQGNNEVPIAGFAADADGVVREINTTNATTEEQQLLSNPNSPLNQIRQTQVRSTEGTFFGAEGGNPSEKSSLSQAGGGSGNLSPTAEGPDAQGGSVPTQNPNQPKTDSEDGGFLIYPLKMQSTKQDRIKFTAVEYQPSGNLATGTIANQNRLTTTGKKIIGSVFLPIQAGISDYNNVEWRGDELNALQKGAVNLSSSAMNAENGEQFKSAFEGAGKKVLEGINANKNEAKVYLAGEAVSIQNLLSRFGSVLNPNLELLFSGPQIRPFEFRFQMSAREKAEGENIKKIIKFFKKNMAVKKSEGAAIFLKAPNTFFIEYKYNGPDETHPGINLIKECALLSCSVEYTPLGTYMTYPDGTMVSYTMSLSFQELEPIYDVDYKDHPIGY
jgi:hypothetical protein